MRKPALTFVSLCLLLAGCGKKYSEIAQQAAEDTPVSATIAVTADNPVEMTILDEHPDMSGYQWLESADPSFVTISLEESERLFSQEGTGVIYYGRTTCPFCQRALPVLDEVLKEYSITAYYVDVGTGYVDNKQEVLLDSSDGKLVYHALVSYIKDTFTVLDSNGNPSFNIPLVIAVKDGKITGSHMALLNDIVISSEDYELTDYEKDEMRAVYESVIESLH